MMEVEVVENDSQLYLYLNKKEALMKEKKYKENYRKKIINNIYESTEHIGEE